MTSTGVNKTGLSRLARLSCASAIAGLIGLVGLVPSTPQAGYDQLAESVGNDLGIDDAEQAFPDVKPLYGTLPGEFEPHDAIMVCGPDDPASYASSPREFSEFKRQKNDTIINLIKEIAASQRVIVVVPSAESRQSAILELTRAEVPLQQVEFVQTPLSTHWVRDFGPYSMRHPETLKMLTPGYLARSGTRDGDVLMAGDFCTQRNTTPIQVPLYIDGGNLLSDGEGLLITTTQTLKLNQRLGYSREQVSRLLRQYFGASQIAYLEPLQREANGHIDMFLTMPDPNTVVLGEYDGLEDSHNRNVLERNVERLRGIKRPRGPLNIVRIPMPPHRDGQFGGSYTNVVYANGQLFVPRFGNTDNERHATAVALYRRLLPDWKIVSVESSAWRLRQGSLHCLTKNIYRL